MCKWGTDREIRIEDKAIKVDACIADELRFLNDSGIETTSSCCGHFKYPPLAIIEGLRSKKKALELGYYPVRRSYWGRYNIDGRICQGVWEIYLKSGGR